MSRSASLTPPAPRASTPANLLSIPVEVAIMKVHTRILAAVAVVFVFAAVTLVAHHSNAAQFDSTKRLTLKGEITKIEWTNPHAYIYVNVKDESGKVVSWSLE